jgi:hypothetical protein
MDYLAVAAPHKANRLWSADTGSTGVTSRAKPVVLRCTRRARADSSIRGAIHCVSQDLLKESRIVGHDCCCEMVGHTLQQIQHCVQLPIWVDSGTRKARGRSSSGC